MSTSVYKTFTYPKEYNEEKCHSFIKEFINLAMFIALDCLKKHSKVFGLDIAESAAYEGCFKAFVHSQNKENPSYLYLKRLVRMCVKRSFWTLCELFGYLPSAGRTYFPKEWVCFEDYFIEVACGSEIYNKIDVTIIDEVIKEFPKKQQKIHYLFLEGYNYCQISKILNYKSKTASLILHKKMLEKIKEKLLNAKHS